MKLYHLEGGGKIMWVAKLHIGSTHATPWVVFEIEITDDGERDERSTGLRAESKERANEMIEDRQKEFSDDAKTGWVTAIEKIEDVHAAI